jgi:hypothetical protein
MFPKRLLMRCGAHFSLRQVPRILGCKLKHAPPLLILVAALTAMGGRVARAQWAPSVRALSSVGEDLYAGIDAAPQNPQQPSSDAVLRSTDHGASWYGIGLTRLSVYALTSSGGNLIASTGDNTQGYYTQDFGKTWTQTNGLDGSMAFCVKDSTIFVASYGISQSKDHGVNWQRVFIDTTILANGFYSIVSNGSDIFAGGDSFYGSTGIYRSTDDGATWTNIGPPSLGVLAIATIGSKLIIGAFGDLPGSILVSSDTGRTWISKLAVEAVSFSQSSSYLFAGTSQNGVLVSSDTGETWSNVALADTDVTVLAISGNYLVAGTWWGNIFRFAISDLIASGGITERSIEQTSFRAYPNPLSESTTIDFMAETAGYASVSIVNALGTEVARLFSGELAAGEHSFTWNAEKNSIPNGMYECLVRMNGRVQQAGLVLMR